MRITKQILECKCEWIRKETGLNIGIQYFNGTQKIVLNGVYEKGFTGCISISYCGSKKELNCMLDTTYNIIQQMKYAGNEYRLDDKK